MMKIAFFHLLAERPVSAMLRRPCCVTVPCHQAIADARHAGCSQHEIVAMFGHGSVRSAAMPDGRTLQRRAGFTFTADAASMEQVRQRFATPRHAIRAQQHRQMYEQSRQVAEDLLGDQRRY